MNQINYHEIYKIEPQRGSLDSKLLEGNVSLDEMVGIAMRKEIRTTEYRLHKREQGECVRFSDDKYNDIAPNILVLDVKIGMWRKLLKRKKPIAALRYQVEERSNKYGYSIYWRDFPSWNMDPENFLGICYVQTMTGVNKRNYVNATKMLGSRPHELLVAHFLSRVAPIVDSQPQTKVVLAPSDLTSRKTIRDRFFDKNWELNPHKERVKQILGPDNAWLKPEAIESRYNHS